MSGVLERMAKRAVGKLPTVQPLLRSIYAPPSMSPIESVAPEFFTRRANDDTTLAPAHQAARANESRSETAQRPAIPAALRPEVADRRERTAKPAEPQTLPQSQQTRAEDPLSSPTPPAAPQPPLRESADEPAYFAATLDRAASTQPTSDDGSSSTFIARELKLAEEPASQRLHINGTTAPPIQRRRSRTPRPASDVPTQEKSEIHISIGSVELRSAPPEAKLAAPAAFRPRLSLHDFLSRKTEGRR